MLCLLQWLEWKGPIIHYQCFLNDNLCGYLRSLSGRWGSVCLCKRDSLQWRTGDILPDYLSTPYTSDQTPVGPTAALQIGFLKSDSATHGGSICESNPDSPHVTLSQFTVPSVHRITARHHTRNAASVWFVNDKTTLCLVYIYMDEGDYISKSISLWHAARKAFQKCLVLVCFCPCD